MRVKGTFNRPPAKISQRCLLFTVIPDVKYKTRPNMICMVCYKPMQETENSYVCGCGHREVK